ncbi:type IV toxin-antitoxin system AbiEi family antitoxin domain-containing protein [Phytoactinopolyspora limicola]|uniref:type IV toxin-antitoxin system AbiEi family antitoxin domain-containing protein n=1 Tax=Phytoactinopolyspora limicola TaxID=2715536 RepID=UPI00140DDA01|nr:type IV toxin-antitoxin system AbiEi family antitoxin domain-containing protein [Phytoactinopolyspora limicola]
MPARITSLPHDVECLLAAGDGLLTLRGAETNGVTRWRLHHLLRAGLLVRLANGVYASAQQLADAAPWPAFALRSRAFILACGPHTHASGWSAVAILNLPTISAPPELPTAVVPPGAGSATNSTFGQVRVAALPLEHRVVVRGTRVTSPARTVVDVARTSPRAGALVVADAALSTMVSRTQLQAVVEFQSSWSGSTGAAWVLDHADPYAESALESLGRLTFIEEDLPVPVSNAWIDLGELRYRPDHLLDDRWLIFEGDGAKKYNNRLDAGRIVGEQREREWRLREAGFEIARYGWQDARHDRRLLGARFRAFIGTRSVRPAPYRWYRESRTYRRSA